MFAVGAHNEVIVFENKTQGTLNPPQKREQYLIRQYIKTAYELLIVSLLRRQIDQTLRQPS